MAQGAKNETLGSNLEGNADIGLVARSRAVAQPWMDGILHLEWMKAYRHKEPGQVLASNVHRVPKGAQNWGTPEIYVQHVQACLPNPSEV